jgi:tyrosyl-tRNA synthetase
LLSLCGVLLFAQDNPQHSQTNQQRTVTTPLLVNVTGCLKKSSTSGGYYVADQDGRTWDLTSKKVDLAKQMFHTVSVSGHPSRSKMQEGKSEQGQKPEGEQTFTLDVTELEVLSSSCTR